jgi:hypothetical protein
MPMADGVPNWASADPNKSHDASGDHWRKAYRPRSFSDYADYTRWIVSRYAPMGVHAYEVWNEPNLVNFWPSGVNATEFTEMLRAAYPVIKAADPQSTVVLGGLSGNDYPYLEKLYDAGAKPYFDAVGVHPYTGIDPNSCWKDYGQTRNSVWAFCGLSEVHASMSARGDGDKPVWATEFGWSTNTGGVSEAQQADYLTKSFTKLETYPWVQKAFWYRFRNVFFLNDNAGDREANFGLLRTDYSTKPAYAAFKAYATAHASAAAPSAPAPAPAPAPQAPAPVQVPEPPAPVQAQPVQAPAAPAPLQAPTPTAAPAPAASAPAQAPATAPAPAPAPASTQVTVRSPTPARAPSPRAKHRPRAHISTTVSMRRAGHRTAGRWQATGRVSGARAGHVVLVLRRWSPARHRWIAVKRLVRTVRSERFAATFFTRATARYRVEATYRRGGLTSVSAPRGFLA